MLREKGGKNRGRPCPGSLTREPQNPGLEGARGKRGKNEQTGGLRPPVCSFLPLLLSRPLEAWILGLPTNRIARRSEGGTTLPNPQDLRLNGTFGQNGRKGASGPLSPVLPQRSIQPKIHEAFSMFWEERARRATTRLLDDRDRTPVSYTHLTLPTTPYV